MNRVFLDTVGLLALWDASDQWHGAASAAVEGLIKRGGETVTSTFGLFEGRDAASRRPYRAVVDDTRATLAAGGRLIVPTEGDWVDAWHDYRRGNAGDAGIVDHVSFIMMRRL